MKSKIGAAVIGILVALSSTMMASDASEKKRNLDLIEQNPDAVSGTPDMVWRYIPSIGWRKFSPMGGQYYDWKEYEKTTKPMWLRRL
jgi:hypothetical protein